MRGTIGTNTASGVPGEAGVGGTPDGRDAPRRRSETRERRSPPPGLRPIGARKKGSRRLTLKPFWGGAVALWGGLVWGYLTMPESTLAPALGIVLCPFGALAGWASGRMTMHLRKRRRIARRKAG